jgi:psiF repeat
MRRHAFVSAILIAMPVVLPLAMVPSAPSFALSAKDKMATCKFGADDQKLDGAARDAFMKKCMSSHNDPRGPGAGMPAAAAAPPKQ